MNCSLHSFKQSASLSAFLRRAFWTAPLIGMSGISADFGSEADVLLTVAWDRDALERAGEVSIGTSASPGGAGLGGSGYRLALGWAGGIANDTEEFLIAVVVVGAGDSADGVLIFAVVPCVFNGRSALSSVLWR